MTSPLQRLFAVFWWLLVAGSVGVATSGTSIAWVDYHSSQEYTAYRASIEALAKLPMATSEPPKPSTFYKSPEAAAWAALPMATAEPDTTTDGQTQRVAAIRNAIDSWEASIQARDTDYARLSGAVRRYAQALILERGNPQTAEQGVALVQAAYDEVKREWGPGTPAPFVFEPDPAPPDPTDYVVGTAAALLVSALPFAVMTVIRWIFTGRWRLSPRW